MIFEDTRNATSSPGSADGPTPSNSPSGETDLFGPALAPASRSQRRAKAKPEMTRAISGPNGFGSSASAALRSSSGNKSPAPSLSGALKVRTRVCRKCKTEKPYSEYYVNSKGNRPSTCKGCVTTMERTRKRRTPHLAEKFKTWRTLHRGHALVNVARHRAKKRGLPCDLVVEEIQARIDAGVCELTGIPFDLSTPRSWNAPSLDQINPGLGYTQANVRVVLYALNVMANTWGPGRIMEIASAISAKRRAASNSLSERLGETLQQTLKSGSTLFVQTWKKRVTPSGHVYWAHTASGRRTSGNGCGSWPTTRATDWKGAGARTAEGAQREYERGAMDLGVAAHLLASWPTPDTAQGGGATPELIARRHGENRKTTVRLDAIAKLASWATPASRDHKDGSSDGTVPTNALLGRQAWLAKPSGPTVFGSPAATGKPGQLNPAFSRWLMGYPPEWDACVPTVTRLSRTSRRRS